MRYNRRMLASNSWSMTLFEVLSIRDPPGIRLSGIYIISCACGQCYIGQMWHAIEIRCTEHQHCLRLCHREQLALADHGEAFEIRLESNILNKEDRMKLSEAWVPALNII